MRTLRPLFHLLLTLTAAAVLVAACGSATPTATNPIVVPTKAPATAAPTQAPTTAAKPTTQPTSKPATEPTKAPTSKPATQPTVAPTAAASAMPEATPVAFGTSLTVGNLAILPTKAERLSVSGTDKPKDGDIFVIVSLTVQNSSHTATVKFDPTKVMLEEGIGAKPFAPMSLASITDSLAAQDIKPDAKVNGRLAYEVPQTALTLDLTFAGENNAQALWTLPDPTLGTELRLGDLALTPMTIERMPQSGADKPQAGDEFVLVTIDIQNLSTTADLHFDPAKLTLLPTGNAKGLTPTALTSLKDQIQAQDIKPGATLKGVVAFEVPKSDSSLEFMYQTDQNQTARWALQG